MFERMIAGESQGEAPRIAKPPAGQLGTPEDMAEGVGALAGASSVTGHTLVVDGDCMIQVLLTDCLGSDRN